MAAQPEHAPGSTAPGGTSPDSASPLVLAGEFPVATADQWRTLVDAVLAKGKPPTEDPGEADRRFRRTLVSHTLDGIEIEPLYPTDAPAEGLLAGLPGTAPFVRGSLPAGHVAHGWDIRARHGARSEAGTDSPAAVNEAILTDLEHGVTSIWLEVGPHALAPTELGRALEGVLLDLAPVVLDAGEEFTAAAEAFWDLVAARELPASAVGGNLGADPLGVLARTGAADIDTLSAEAAALAARAVATHGPIRAIMVDALPYHEAGGSEAEELGASIATGVAYLRALTAAGLGIDDACGQIEFRYAADADQFLTIAKLRAARKLWSRITSACGTTDPRRAAQRQHVVTSTVMTTRRDPWVNMLRATVSCFGAGVGGADAVTVTPFDAALGQPDDLGRRVARNTQSLLIEESHVARVIDPAGGSPYVEHLTEAIAASAWEWFQAIESAGGMEQALRSGLVADRLAATWERRRADIANRRTPITGVSEFPDIAEALPARPATIPPPTGGLPRVRLAEGYESLRDAADAAGVAPSIVLITLGPVSAFTARATFAKNMFEAGGITTIIGAGDTAADQFATSGASIACICSSDAVYAEHASDAAAALRAAGAQRVYLAGRPSKTLEPTLREAGVDEFVFVGVDVLDVLTRAHDILGVSA